MIVFLLNIFWSLFDLGKCLSNKLRNRLATWRWHSYWMVGWARLYFGYKFGFAFSVPFYWILISLGDNHCFLVLFHIHSLMCVWCIHSISPVFSAGENNFQSQILKRGDQKKMTVWGGLKEFLPCWIFAWGCLLCFLSKKDF